jgi:putative endonuclease
MMIKDREMMSKHNTRAALGSQGERLAQAYLEAEGYQIESINWRGQRGELDLIVRQADILVIVEVRTTSTSWLDRPAEATPISKQRQVARCADEYLSKRPSHLPKIIDIRFDVIGVLIPKYAITDDQVPTMTSISETKILLDHVDNAYSSPWAF